ncbi:methyltransferase domain-containing protein [Candidatus Sumerlaeota bacterium]|nr:methyltransferase domain-containing protein [Candidatus Sumerlaeota bacterium]
MELVCPTCCGAMRSESDAWLCEPCARRYPVRDGVACFLEDADPFYEGMFTGTRHAERPETFPGRLLLPFRIAWSLDMHYTALLRRHLSARHRRILDLGCGGGNGELLRYGAEVAGADLSFASLRNAATVYSCVAQTSASRLPFPDDYFDALASFNFLGHVAPDEKEAVYAEMRRVLKPGGLALHNMETSSEGALFRYVRRDPEFYQRQMIDLDGHVGIELPSRALQRFRDEGFDVVNVRRDHVWYFFPYGQAKKRFDDDFSRRNLWLRLLLQLDHAIENRPRLQKAWDLVMGVPSSLFAALAPLDRTIGLSVALRKRN